MLPVMQYLNGNSMRLWRRISATYCLTRRLFCDIVDGRMEEHRSFFYAQNHILFMGQRPHTKKMEVEVVRTRITLACTECKQRNYNMTKDKKTHPDRMETKKYCRFCKTHTLHKETK